LNQFLLPVAERSIGRHAGNWQWKDIQDKLIRASII